MFEARETFERRRWCKSRGKEKKKGSWEENEIQRSRGWSLNRERRLFLSRFSSRLLYLRSRAPFSRLSHFTTSPSRLYNNRDEFLYAPTLFPSLPLTISSRFECFSDDCELQTRDPLLRHLPIDFYWNFCSTADNGREFHLKNKFYEFNKELHQTGSVSLLKREEKLRKFDRRKKRWRIVSRWVG